MPMLAGDGGCVSREGQLFSLACEPRAPGRGGPWRVRWCPLLVFGSNLTATAPGGGRQRRSRPGRAAQEAACFPLDAAAHVRALGHGRACREGEHDELHADVRSLSSCGADIPVRGTIARGRCHSAELRFTPYPGQHRHAARIFPPANVPNRTPQDPRGCWHAVARKLPRLRSSPASPGIKGT